MARVTIRSPKRVARNYQPASWEGMSFSRAAWQLVAGSGYTLLRKRSPGEDGAPSANVAVSRPLVSMMASCLGRVVPVVSRVAQ